MSDAAQPVMPVIICRCGKVLDTPVAYVTHCAAHPEHFVTTVSDRDAALEAAAKVADARAEIDAECEHLSPMDWETGVRECSRESRRGAACLCAERAEEAEEIAKLIRQLKGK